MNPIHIVVRTSSKGSLVFTVTVYVILRIQALPRSQQLVSFTVLQKKLVFIDCILKCMKMEVSNVRDEDWRNSRKTRKDQLEFLVDNEFASDMKFALKITGDEIFGHKFPLSVASPVFAAMFHGTLATKENIIEILDCDNKEIFVEFLRYLYSRRCKLDWDNVFDILYLAKKYLVSTLVEECVKFLSQDININNALLILQQSSKFEEEELKLKCVKFIAPNVKEVLKTEYFIKLDLDTLKVILENDKLEIREIELFKFVETWCDHKLSGNGKAGDSNAKRDLLGDVLYLIRFPIMGAAEFAENCAQSGFLSLEECCSIFCYLTRKTGSATEDHKLASELISQHGFSFKKRVPPPHLKCYTRASRYYSSGWNYLGNIDAVRFSVSKAIKLYGVTIFGDQLKNTIQQMYVINSKKEKVNLGLLKPQNLPTSCIRSAVLVEDSFVVAFEKEPDILPGEKYDICLHLSGPSSKEGIYQIEGSSNNSIFTFYDSKISTNGTSSSHGQFPEFWYADSGI